MSRQTELMALSEQLPYVLQKDFIFFFQCYAYEPAWTRLNFTPQGWKGSKWQITRSMKYMGLTRKVSVDTLTFIKDGRDYLQAVYEQVGINADVSFRVWKKDKSTYGWISYFVGRIDMATYRITELGVEVQIVDTSFHEKIMNRIGTKVDIRRTDSLGGFSIPPFASEDPKINLPTFNNYGSAQWEAPSSGLSVGVTGTHHLPMDEVDGSDFTETQDQTIAGNDPYFAASTLATRGFTVNGRIQATYAIGAIESGNIYFYLNYGSTQVQIAHYEINFPTPAGGTIDIDFEFSEQYQLAFTETAYLTMSISQVNSSYYSLNFTDVDVWLAGVAEFIYGYNFTAYPLYEAFLRVCQLIGDGNDVFKSDYFGRTDTPVITYGSDGILGHVTRGYFIREKYNENNTIALSLADLFDSLNGMFQLGMGIEEDSGTYRVRVENLEYFFNLNLLIDLSDEIREENISKEVIPDLHYNLIKAGYSSYDYEKIGGLYEYNTKTEFATRLDAVINTIDLVSKYRADTSGIINLALKRGADEDVKGDEDVFLLDSVRDGSDWDIRTDEGFTDIDGGAEYQKYFNVYWSPKRNILRNGDRIRAGLQKYLGSSLKWQTLDKNTNLRSKLTTESDYVEEDADELVNDLAVPFFVPEKYMVEVPLTAAQITAIDANPMRMIKLSDDKYGWILNIEVENETGLANIELLRSLTAPIP